jgi:hypothetical protein
MNSMPTVNSTKPNEYSAWTSGTPGPFLVAFGGVFIIAFIFVVLYVVPSQVL